MAMENYLKSTIHLCRRLLVNFQKDPKFRRGIRIAGALNNSGPLTSGSWKHADARHHLASGAKLSSTVPIETKEFDDYNISSPHPDLDLSNNIPLHEYLLNEFAKYGDRTALVDGITGNEISYSKLQTMIVKIASALAGMGFGPGSIATLYGHNCPEYLVMMIAVGATGGTVSTVNPAYTPEELHKAINLVQSSVLISSPELLANIKDVSKHCPSLKNTIVLGDAAEGYHSYSSLLDNDMSLFPRGLNIDCKETVFSIPFSSGTTGLPKGVMLTHDNILSNVLQCRMPNVGHYKPGEDCLISVLPFFHIYGQVTVAMVGLASGIKIVSLPKFDPMMYLQAIQKHKATYLHVVPPLMLFLGKHPVVSKFDLSSVSTVFTGAAPCGADTIHEVSARFKNRVQIRQGYGLTEASPLTHCNPPEHVKYNSCGHALHNTQFKIVDIDSRKSLDKGENGEVLVRGPQVMKGYYNNEKATNETIVDGWLCTGDIGHYDDDGYLVIVDRIKELIKVKGLQVAPAELESLLLTHHAIADAAVIGQPDDRLGEAPVAFIVLKPNYKPLDNLTTEIHAFISDRVAPYKRLVGGIHYRKEIPKAASGKILRRVLKQELQ